MVERMDLGEIRADIATGAIIARGRISLNCSGIVGDRLYIPDHEYVSVESTSNRIEFRPAISIDRVDICCYEVAYANLRVIFHSLDLESLQNTLFRKEEGVTDFYSGVELATARCLEPMAQNLEISLLVECGQIDEYELRAGLAADGLSISISGELRLAIAETKTSSSAKFEINATVPWSMLALRNFSCHILSHKYQKTVSAPTTPEIAPVSRPLQIVPAMFLSSVTGTPFVRGSIVLDGRRELTQARYGPEGNWIYLNISARLLRCDHVSFIELKADGLADGAPGPPCFNFDAMGRNTLDELFSIADYVAMSGSSYAGTIAHFSGYSRVDNGGDASQPIVAWEFQGRLGRQGLSLRIWGELGPIDQETRGDMTGQGNRKFEVEMLLPWPLLAAKGFVRLARRRANILTDDTSK